MWHPGFGLALLFFGTVASCFVLSVKKMPRASQQCQTRRLLGWAPGWWMSCLQLLEILLLQSCEKHEIPKLKKRCSSYVQKQCVLGHPSYMAQIENVFGNECSWIQSVLAPQPYHPFSKHNSNCVPSNRCISRAPDAAQQ